MRHGWHWQQREYDVEPGELRRMVSGTVVEVLKVFGANATVRLVSKGKRDSTPRLPRQVSLMPCCMLERFERVSG